jgi:hypothetical protein
MIFRIQFLNAASSIIADWPCRASDADGAIEAADELSWPADAVRIQIVDDGGRVIHKRRKEEEP